MGVPGNKAKRGTRQPQCAPGASTTRTTVAVYWKHCTQHCGNTLMTLVFMADAAHPMSHKVRPLINWYRSQGWNWSMEPLYRLVASSTRARRCCGSHSPQVVRDVGSILQDSDL